MKLIFGIKGRLLANIGLIVIATYLFFNFLFQQIVERDLLLGDITENYQPSLTKLAQLYDKFEESDKLMRFWSLNPFDKEGVFREEFNFLFTSVFPSLQSELTEMSNQWVVEDQELLIKTLVLITDSLYFSYIGYISDIKDLSVDNDDLASNSEMLLAESGIIFLLSEIEQNLNFLMDRRNVELDSIYYEISEKTHKLKSNVILLSLIFFLLISVIFLMIFRHLNLNISLLEKNLTELAQGRLPKEVIEEDKNEFSALNNKLNELSRYMAKLTMVTKNIEKNDFSSDFKSLGEDDELGNVVINLQEHLRQANEDQNRYQIEEEERNWISSSIAKINYLLQNSTDKIEDLGYEIIKALVEFTNSKIGGVFLLNDQNEKDVKIEMIAAYAYDRKKYLKKTILKGEGLIGRCVDEKETIYLSDVPENYLSIKSGLGENNALYLLLVPLYLNENIYGVIELASFIDIEKYKIGFVETIGENIATTISKLKTNLQTTNLFEQTKQQAEELLAQEEEMRQNMEELKEIQEKSSVREQILQKEIESLKSKK